MKLTIRSQALIGIGAIEIIVLTVLLYSVFHFIDRSTVAEVDRRAESIARVFAATAANDVLALDLGALQSFVNAVVKTPGTAVARVLDHNGHLLAEAGSSDSLSRPFNGTRDEEGLPDLYLARSTIDKAGVNYGAVEVGLDLRTQKAAIGRVKGTSILIAAVEVLAAALFSIAAGHYLVRRLGHIRRVLQRVNQGEYFHRIRDTWVDEVSDVASEIDRLTERIASEQSSYDRRISELDELNALLQRKLSDQERQ